LFLVLSPVFINGNSRSSLFEGAAGVYYSSVTFIARLIDDRFAIFLFLGEATIPIIIRGLFSMLLSMFLRHPYLGGWSSILGDSLPG
jgi:hypothetical protein